MRHGRPGISASTLRVGRVDSLAWSKAGWVGALTTTPPQVGVAQEVARPDEGLGSAVVTVIQAIPAAHAAKRSRVRVRMEMDSVREIACVSLAAVCTTRCRLTDAGIV